MSSCPVLAMQSISGAWWAMAVSVGKKGMSVSKEGASASKEGGAW